MTNRDVSVFSVVSHFFLFIKNHVKALTATFLGFLLVSFLYFKASQNIILFVPEEYAMYSLISLMVLMMILFFLINPLLLAFLLELAEHGEYKFSLLEYCSQLKSEVVLVGLWLLGFGLVVGSFFVAPYLPEFLGGMLIFTLMLLVVVITFFGIFAQAALVDRNKGFKDAYLTSYALVSRNKWFLFKVHFLFALLQGLLVFIFTYCVEYSSFLEELPLWFGQIVNFVGSNAGLFIFLIWHTQIYRALKKRSNIE